MSISRRMLTGATSVARPAAAITTGLCLGRRWGGPTAEPGPLGARRRAVQEKWVYNPDDTTVADPKGAPKTSPPRRRAAQHPPTTPGAIPRIRLFSARRIALLFASCGFMSLYLFVTFVALVTSGNDLIQDPVFYYAVLVPSLYALFCALTAVDRIPVRMLKPLGIAVNLIALPALRFCLLGLGLLLPVIAILWYMVYREVKATTPLRRTAGRGT